MKCHNRGTIINNHRSDMEAAYSLGYYEESRLHTSVHYVRIHRSNIGTIICNPSRFATAVMAPGSILPLPPPPFQTHAHTPFRQCPRFVGPATPAHPFPAIFGNFHPFIRLNNTLARLFEREIAFSPGKSPYRNQENDDFISLREHIYYTRCNHSRNFSRIF